MARLQNPDVLFKARFNLGLGRHFLGFESRQHIAQCRDGNHPRRYLLGTLVWISVKINKRIGQLLQLRRRGRDLKPAKLRINITRRRHRLNDRAVLIGRPVCRKSLSRRRCPHRQTYFRCIVVFAGRDGDLESGRSGLNSGNRKTHLGAVICLDNDPLAVGGRVSSPTVREGLYVRRALTYVRATDTDFHVCPADNDIDSHVLIRLILDYDREINLVAKIHKPRRRRANHQRLFCRNGRFSLAEPLACIDRNRRDAITRQIVR